MMRLVQSSVPGAVERDQAVWLLIERAVLSRAICRELEDSGGKLPNRRVLSALFFLLQWIERTLPECLRGEPYPKDGIEQMVVPAGYERLLQEIRAGAEVAHALFLYLMADSTADKVRLPGLLASYWKECADPVQVPWFAN
jgi:hypothetical protein